MNTERQRRLVAIGDRMFMAERQEVQAKRHVFAAQLSVDLRASATEGDPKVRLIVCMTRDMKTWWEQRLDKRESSDLTSFNCLRFVSDIELFQICYSLRTR